MITNHLRFCKKNYLDLVIYFDVSPVFVETIFIAKDLWRFVKNYGKKDWWIKFLISIDKEWNRFLNTYICWILVILLGHNNNNCINEWTQTECHPINEPLGSLFWVPVKGHLFTSLVSIWLVSLPLNIIKNYINFIGDFK